MDFSDFGRYLAQQRELRGMSREDVSRATKIPATLIVALESGQVDRLPARVFVLNYVKAYSQVIGLSSEEAVLRFEEVDCTVQSTPPPAALERDRRRKAYRTLALLLIGLAAGGYALLVFLGHLPSPVR
ncbi:MAG: helix-turn-helix domain-containing protein [Myxococcales bacterium]|nr:helix-turn-helix domain-containing protein [Myxococcales bacterium]